MSEKASYLAYDIPVMTPTDDHSSGANELFTKD